MSACWVIAAFGLGRCSGNLRKKPTRAIPVRNRTRLVPKSPINDNPKLRRAAGASIVLAISTDMAHYPPADAAARVTRELLPAIEGLLPEELARAEAAERGGDAGPGLVCGMCGIEPAVLGLAALRAMGATPGVALASATSADAGADPRRAVGYLAVAFGG